MNVAGNERGEPGGEPERRIGRFRKQRFLAAAGVPPNVRRMTPPRRAMKACAKADLYVLRSSEGGRLLALHSGYNAHFSSDEHEDGVILELIGSETLRAGESGLASLTFLRPGIQRPPIDVGQMFELSVHGVRSAVGQILSVDDDDTCRHVATVETIASDTDEDPPRIVSLLGTLSGGLCILLFARDAGPLWHILIALGGCFVAGVVWSVYSEFQAARNSRNRDEIG